MTPYPISPEDQQLIGELRQKVAKYLPLCPSYDHDLSLLRWLIGWDRKIDVILPKLIFSIRACHALGLHQLQAKTVNDIYNFHIIYQNEAVKLMPGRMLGFDKNGHSIFLTSCGSCDFGDLLKCIKLSDLYLFNLVNTYGMLDMTRHKELELGTKSGNICIVDMEGAGFHQMMSMNKGASVPKLTQEMFPDLMVRIYIINAPSFMQMLAKMFMAMLSEQTRQKIQILGSNYKEVLVAELGEDVLFEKWGGKRKNEEDVSLMGIGKAIPKSLYYQMSNDMDPEKLKKLTISHGKTEVVPIHLEGRVPGRKLHWWWRLDSGNIWFTVMRGTEEKLDIDDDHMCWPRFELHTDPVPEWNEISAEEPGIYKLLFENDSYIWSKTVRYFIEITEMIFAHGFLWGYWPEMFKSYFPLILFKVSGLYEYFGDIGGTLSVLVVIISGTLSVVSVMETCFIRCVITYDIKFFLKFRRGIPYAAFQSVETAVGTAIMTIILFPVIKGKHGFEEFARRHGAYQLLQQFGSDVITFVDPDTPVFWNIAIPLVVAVLLCFPIIIFGLTYLTHRKIMKTAQLMSSVNRSLQKKLTILLLVQALLPITMMFTPAYIMAVAMLIVFAPPGADFNLYNQPNLGYPIVTTSFTLYPFINTLATIVIIKPYRETLCRLNPFSRDHQIGPLPAIKTPRIQLE